MHLETYIVDLIEGRKQSSILKGILYGMSQFFETGVKIRNFAFDKNWIKENKVSIPVLSVGNIIAGGAGKTALIQLLAKDLSAKGKISILSRGYRSKAEKTKEPLCLQMGFEFPPDVCGDEPFILSKSLPEASLFIGKDRLNSAKKAVEYDADLILLDDGMQYRSLYRDFELIILHAEDLYGKGFYLPRGYLRDSPKRLSVADFIFINHIQDENQFNELKNELRSFTSAPIIGVQMIPKRAVNALGEEWKSLNQMRVSVFCGLGKPSSFYKTIESMGAHIAEKWILPDHMPPSEKELRDFVNLSEERGSQLILCSEKDWVKLPLHLQLTLPIAYVDAELQVVCENENYQKLIQMVSEKIEMGK